MRVFYIYMWWAWHIEPCDLCDMYIHATCVARRYISHVQHVYIYTYIYDICGMCYHTKTKPKHTTKCCCTKTKCGCTKQSVITHNKMPSWKKIVAAQNEMQPVKTKWHCTKQSAAMQKKLPLHRTYCLCTKQSISTQNERALQKI